MRKLMGAVLAALMMMTAQAASAATTFNFSYAGTVLGSGAAFSGSGQLFTDDGTPTPVNVGGTTVDVLVFQITGATGTSLFDGITSTITGISNTFSPLNQLVGLNGDFQLLETELTFSATPDVLVFSLDTVGTYLAGNADVLAPGTTFSVAAVPEPATWAMMLLGFAIVGATMRRRRVTVAFAA